MNNLGLLPIIVTGLFISVLHSMIPTHWLPFVMASRTQKWDWSKTLSILLIAGFGHVIMTTLLGAAIFSLGMGVHRFIHQYFIFIACFSVAAFGVYQIYKFRIGKKHSHCNNTHEHHHSDELRLKSSDGWAVLSLLSLLTFSPCESFLPVYLSAVGYGWQGFVFLSITLAVGTLVTMVSFTWISAKTIARFEMNWLEDNELLITGCGLIALSVILYFIERSHII
jgi:hypothetical protein